MKDPPEQRTVTDSSGCVFKDLNVPCQNPECTICNFPMFHEVMREFGYKQPPYPHWAEVVEVAIERERERCAKIAENWITEFGVFSSTGEAIAKKIRSRE